MMARASFSVIFTCAAMALAMPGIELRAKNTVGFAADSTINANGIFNTLKEPKDAKVVATFPDGSGTDVQIFDQGNLLGGEVLFSFLADMDVDCDGAASNCPNNPDGQPQTNFGKLDATKVPFFVIPDSFFDAHKSQIKPNSLGAIICNGKMFYGIMGDTDGDNPQVIGEASLLMAQTCFPRDGLDGGTGHSDANVLYVVFGSQVPEGVQEKTIDIDALKTLGDQQAAKLAKALGV